MGIVTRLRQGLVAEARASKDLRLARCEIVEAVRGARAEGSGYFEIATAIVPATGDVRETIRRRERFGANLRSRVFESRCRR